MKLIPIAAIVIACFLGDVNADIHWEQTDTSVISGETITIRQEIFISETRFVIDNKEGLRIILDLSDNSVTTIDMQEKVYFTITLDEMREIRETIQKETDRIIEEAIRSIPESEREDYRKQLDEQIRKSRDGDTDTTVTEPAWDTYESTGKTEKILDYTASQYTAKTDSGTVYELWCTGDFDISEIRDFFMKVENIRFLGDIGTHYSTMPLGFPLKFVIRKDDTVTESTVTSIDFDPIANTVFTIPPGFTLSQPELPTSSDH